MGRKAYQAVYTPNVKIEKPTDFYIHTGEDYASIRKHLVDSILIDEISFDLLAKKMNYAANIHPGRYILHKGMSNRELISLLRSGRQIPVKVIFNKARTVQEIADICSQQLEFEANDLKVLLNKPHQIKGLENFDSQNPLALFIPNTYEFYWNTSAQGFIERMLKEYDKFWSKERIAKAKRQGLTSQEAMTLASIVEEESNLSEERPIIAGLYLNRLNRGILLQADPTVRYALGDFEIRRVLNKHLDINSPYNTYKFKGLPPAPICTPSITSINAVLNPTVHNYLYMCAKADFSGKHAFASTLREHMKNARAFQKALNEKKIYQ